MACFVVSVAEAIVAATARHIVRHQEKKALTLAPRKESLDSHGNIKFGSTIPWSKKLAYLEIILFSGSFLLLGEHILHGEIVPYFPFFTAMSNAADMAEMFHEMATVGVAMAVVLTLAWALGVLIADTMAYRQQFKKNVYRKENK